MKTIHKKLTLGVMALGLTAFTATAQVVTTANFTAGEGWVNGSSVQFGDQAGNTSGISFLTQGAIFNVDTTAGTISNASQSFLRAIYSTGGPGSPELTPMDVALGGSITLDWSMDIVGEGAVPANNRILGEFALTTLGTPGNATTGNASGTNGFGFQLISDGINYNLDPGGFNQNEGRVDTGVAAGSAINLTARYTEISATNTLMEVFVNGSGTALYSASETTGLLAGSGLYGWFNTSNGTGTAPVGDLTFSSIGITTQVPEPSTFALLGMGALGLTLLRRRK